MNKKKVTKRRAFKEPNIVGGGEKIQINQDEASMTELNVEKDIHCMKNRKDGTLIIRNILNLIKVISIKREKNLYNL